MPKKQDTIFRIRKRCREFETVYQQIMNSSVEGAEFMVKNRDLIAYWSKMSEENLTKFSEVANLHKKLSSTNDQPDWAKEAIKPNGPMEYISEIAWKLRGSPEIVRYVSGFLLKEILERTAEKINSTLHPDRLFWLYSSHTSNMGPLLNSFGDFERNVPPHGSSIHFELYKTSENQHYLQFFYRKPDDEYPPPIPIQGCGVKWTLEQFYSTHGNLIPGDFETECTL